MLFPFSEGEKRKSSIPPEVPLVRLVEHIGQPADGNLFRPLFHHIRAEGVLLYGKLHCLFCRHRSRQGIFQHILGENSRHSAIRSAASGQSFQPPKGR